MSDHMMYNIEIFISKTSLGKFNIPKTSNETWDKTYVQSRGVSRQNIWLFSCAGLTLMATQLFGEKSGNHFLFSWLTFKPDKYLSQACYATAQLFWTSLNEDKSILLGRKLGMVLHGVVTTCSVTILNRILVG